MRCLFISSGSAGGPVESKFRTGSNMNLVVKNSILARVGVILALNESPFGLERAERSSICALFCSFTIESKPYYFTFLAESLCAWSARLQASRIAAIVSAHGMLDAPKRRVWGQHVFLSTCNVSPSLPTADVDSISSVIALARGTWR